MRTVKRLSPRVLRVLGCNPGKFTLQGTNTYILGTGSERLLIDTGEGRPEWLAHLIEVLGQEHASLSMVLVTHGHHDHTGGIDQLMTMQPPPIIYKHNPEPGQQQLLDGATIQVEGATLQALYSPGHTADHMSFLLKEEDALFTGDNVLGQGTAVFEDLGKYLRSLKIMQAAFHGRAYPGHGPLIKDGPARIAEYIEHRAVREAQVVAILRSCPDAAVAANSYCAWRSVDITRHVYPELSPDLFEAAHKGVVLILKKLEQEVRVLYDANAETWKLLDRHAKI